MNCAARPRLAFVSTLFLQPEDTGGRIRTCNTLRGMKGGRFEITLLSPAESAQHERYRARIEALCDHFVSWVPPPERPRWQRALELWSELPVSVATSLSRPAAAAIDRVLQEREFDVVVFDFVHATPLMPPAVRAATVCFTHNVETEIFDRHAQRASSALMRRVWSQQAKKMRRFEMTALARYDGVVAVSERDARMFASEFACPHAATIPTGVDLDYFAFAPPAPAADALGGKLVFTGSMDWAANIDGLRFFITEVWPKVLSARPRARFEAVGRNPPDSLLRLAEANRGVRFTGRVEDIRPHVRDAQVFVIPLRVGGGTRIKAFEAMAMGCPVVSTGLGVEGLDVVADDHLLVRDDAEGLAQAVLRLLDEPELGARLALQARRLVQSLGHDAAAEVFESVCWNTMQKRRAADLVAA